MFLLLFQDKNQYIANKIQIVSTSEHIHKYTDSTFLLLRILACFWCGLCDFSQNHDREKLPPIEFVRCSLIVLELIMAAAVCPGSQNIYISFSYT